MSLFFNVFETSGAALRPKDSGSAKATPPVAGLPVSLALAEDPGMIAKKDTAATNKRQSRGKIAELIVFFIVLLVDSLNLFTKKTVGSFQ